MSQIHLSTLKKRRKLYTNDFNLKTGGKTRHLDATLLRFPLRKPMREENAFRLREVNLTFRSASFKIRTQNVRKNLSTND